MAPEKAYSGRFSGPTMARSVVRPDRTGPTWAAPVDWKTTAKRLFGPSIFSSYTTSACSRPPWGRAAGSTSSILTTSAGRPSDAGSAGSPVSGASGAATAVVEGAVEPAAGRLVAGPADSPPRTARTMAAPKADRASTTPTTTTTIRRVAGDIGYSSWRAAMRSSSAGAPAGPAEPSGGASQRWASANERAWTAVPWSRTFWRAAARPGG